MAKKYYWLKLKEDFFSSPKIKKLRRIAGGDTYTLIYLKMQLLSIKNGGIIEYQGIEQTFAEELALILDEDKENVQITLSFLLAQGLMEQSDDKSFLLTQAAENIGSETDSAARVRSFRERKALQCNALVTSSNKTVTLDKDIEKDKEINNNRRFKNDERLSEDQKEILSYCHDLIGKFTPQQDALVLKAAEGIQKESAIDAICIAYERGARTAEYVAKTIESQKEHPERKPGGTI